MAPSLNADAHTQGIEGIEGLRATSRTTMDFLAYFWTAVAAVWTAFFFYSILQTRALIDAVAEAGGGASALSDAVWTGEFQGESFNLAPDSFELAIGGVVAYAAGVILLLANAFRFVSPLTPEVREQRSFKTVQIMLAIVAMQVALFVVFRTELDIAAIHTDS